MNSPLRCPLFVFLLFFIISCQKANNREIEGENHSTPEDSLNNVENSLYKEVMAIHDQAMPAMSELMTLNKQLKQKADDLSDPKEKKELMAISAELEAANESMMNWMRKFNPNLENMSHRETLNYLQEEKRKIEEVRVKMTTAQRKAELSLR